MACSFILLHAVGASMHQRGVGYLRNLSGSLDIMYTLSQEVLPTQEGICTSTNTQHSLEYPGVGFYTSKILCKTAMFEMSAFQYSTSPGLNPISGVQAFFI